MRQLVQRLLVIVLTLALAGALERSAFSDNNDPCPLTSIQEHVNVTLAESLIVKALLTPVPVAFSSILKTYTGRAVVLDPGIPKRIA
jgi:hypothetical protein